MPIFKTSQKFSHQTTSFSNKLSLASFVPPERLSITKIDNHDRPKHSEKSPAKYTKKPNRSIPLRLTPGNYSRRGKLYPAIRNEQRVNVDRLTHS